MRTLPLLLALAGLGTTAVVAHRLGPQPSVSVARPITTFPERWRQWQGVDRPVSERLVQLLETREILYRDYQDAAGNGVLACVAVAGGNRKVAHPPAICYRGQGWDILFQEQQDWELAGRRWPVEVLQLHKDGRTRMVVSWYRVGDRATSSYLQQQWWGVQEDLRNSGAPSALFRFSTDLDRERPARAQAVLTAFLDDFLVPLEEALERRTTAPDGREP